MKGIDIEDARSGLADSDDAKLALAAAETALRRTVEIRIICERRLLIGKCQFPRCDGCGVDRLFDRGQNAADAAVDHSRVATREFQPDVRQAIVITAIHAAIGNVCATPEDAIALLTVALSDYVEKICKPQYRKEAFLTVIECLRINAGMTKDEITIQG